MKKIIIIGAVIFIAWTAFTVTRQLTNRPLSEAGIREEFRCDRFTAEELATDIYCANSEYYYDDLKNGTIIDATDFHDRRYKALSGT